MDSGFAGAGAPVLPGHLLQRSPPPPPPGSRAAAWEAASAAWDAALAEGKLLAFVVLVTKAAERASRLPPTNATGCYTPPPPWEVCPARFVRAAAAARWCHLPPRNHRGHYDVVAEAAPLTTAAAAAVVATPPWTRRRLARPAHRLLAAAGGAEPIQRRPLPKPLPRPDRSRSR